MCLSFTSCTWTSSLCTSASHIYGGSLQITTFLPLSHQIERRRYVYHDSCGGWKQTRLTLARAWERRISESNHSIVILPLSVFLLFFEVWQTRDIFRFQLLVTSLVSGLVGEEFYTKLGKMMMIAFITIKSSLVPLIEGLCVECEQRYKKKKRHLD